MEQFVLVPASFYNNNKNFNTQTVTKQVLPKYQVEKNPTYRIDSFQKEGNKKLFANADCLVDKTLSCPRTKPSNPHTLILNGVETGVLLSDFAKQLRCNNADVPDIYFTSLDAATISPNLVLNQNTKTKQRGSWAPFKIWTTEAAKIVNAEDCCFWVCAQFSGN